MTVGRSLPPLCCLLLLVQAAATGVVGSPADPGELHRNAAHADAAQAAGSAVPSPHDEIDPALANVHGEVVVYVRLDRIRSRNASVAALRNRTAERQQGVVDYAAARAGVTVRQQFWLVNAVLLRVDTNRVNLTRLAAVPGVRAVDHRPSMVRSSEEAPTGHERPASAASSTPTPEPNTTPTPHPPVPVDRPETTWAVEATNATGVWEQYGTKGEGVRVAVIDKGIDPSHPSLDLYTEDASDPTDPGGWAEFDGGERIEGTQPHLNEPHGQAVSGLLAADDATGRYLGVAPGVELQHVAADNDKASTIAGIEWAIEHGADVISLSRSTTGAYSSDSPLFRAVWRAERLGSVVVVSAGNTGPNEIYLPGTIVEAINVGAYDRLGRVSPFSSSGTISRFSGPDSRDRQQIVRYPGSWPLAYPQPDVIAPGESLPVPSGSSGVRTFRGTSGSSPLVAGALALMESAADREVRPGVLKTALQCTAEPPPNADDADPVRYGAGMVDAYAATEAVVDGQDIRGRIVDADGNVVPRARVSVSPCSRYSTHDGSYALYADAGERTLRVEAPGYRPKTVSVAVENGSDANRTIQLERAPVVRNWNDTYPADFVANGVAGVHAEVTDLESISVAIGGNNTVDPDRVNVTFVGYRDGRYVRSTLSLGESHELASPYTNRLLLQLTVAGEYEGRLHLAVTFGRDGQQRSRHVRVPFSTPSTPTPTATPAPTSTPTPTATQTPTPTVTPDHSPEPSGGQSGGSRQGGPEEPATAEPSTTTARSPSGTVTTASETPHSTASRTVVETQTAPTPTTVPPGADSPTPGSEHTAVETPGFSAVVALLSVSCLVALGRRRRR